MLKFILGRSGTGKTGKLVDICASLTDKGTEVIFIVPEQASFDAERRILMSLGEKRALLSEVLSFTRLSDRILRTFGGIAASRITKSGRVALINAALSAVSDTLTVYPAKKRRGDVAQMMLDAIDEFKTRRILPEDIRRVAASEGDSMLGKRLGDISSVYGAYEALLAGTGTDPRDLPSLAAQRLAQNNFFAGKAVIIDSFKSFTPAEEEILKYILIQSEEVYISLCCDGLNDEDGGCGLFSPVKTTAQRIMQCAKRYSVSVASPLILNNPVRFENPALAAVEDKIYGYDDKSEYDGECFDVKIVSAADLHQEAMACAAEIKRLVRSEGLRYRDIAVIVRDEARWNVNISSVMSMFSVPVFIDRRMPADSFPITIFVIAAMDAVNSGWKSSHILRWLKTGLTDITEDEISLLENYIFTWDISGRAWLSPFTGNPAGYAPKSDKTDEQLEIINDIRQRAIAPLERLEQGMSGSSAAQIAACVYTLMTDCHADTHLEQITRQMEADGYSYGQEQLRMWDTVVQLLDEAALIMGASPIEPEEFARLFGLMLSAADLGSIPSHTDEVTFAAADRVRLSNPKVLFILGANDGEFPKKVSQYGIFSDIERRRLIDMGLNVAVPSEGAALDERLLTYMIISQPSMRLYVSYCRAGADSKAKTPSEIIIRLQEIFPKLQITEVQSPRLPEEIESAAQAFSLMARSGQQNSFTAALQGYFKEQPRYQSVLSALERTHSEKGFAFENDRAAQRLFGQKQQLSSTRVETFHTCRFMYFCRFGLNVYPRPAARVDAMRYGSVMHYIFEHIFAKYGGKGIGTIPTPELKDIIRQLLWNYMETEMGGTQDKSARFMYLFERLADTALLLLQKMGEELAQSDFEVAACELSINPGGDIEPLTVTTESGIELSVTGFVDRVDVMKNEEGCYFRVVDYKTGTKEFRLGDILYGLNMQMLIYLTAIWKNGDRLFPDALPAGVLYMPAKRPMPSDSREKSAKDGSDLRMNGLLLENPKVLQGMERALEGRFIPVKSDKSGHINGGGRLVTLKQFGQIAAHIEYMLVQMAQALSKGEIEALPAVHTLDPCQYCDYIAVCGHEADDPFIEVKKWDNDAVMEELSQEVSEQ